MDIWPRSFVERNAGALMQVEMGLAKFLLAWNLESIVSDVPFPLIAAGFYSAAYDVALGGIRMIFPEDFHISPETPDCSEVAIVRNFKYVWAGIKGGLRAGFNAYRSNSPKPKRFGTATVHRLDSYRTSSLED